LGVDLKDYIGRAADLGGHQLARSRKLKGQGKTAQHDSQCFICVTR
jgi:hypothetical protein